MCLGQGTACAQTSVIETMIQDSLHSFINVGVELLQDISAEFRSGDLTMLAREERLRGNIDVFNIIEAKVEGAREFSLVHINLIFKRTEN